MAKTPTERLLPSGSATRNDSLGLDICHHVLECFLDGLSVVFSHSLATMARGTALSRLASDILLSGARDLLDPLRRDVETDACAVRRQLVVALINRLLQTIRICNLKCLSSERLLAF